MLKKHLLLYFLIYISPLFATSVQAQVKTSSLTIEKPEVIKLIPQCENMFNVANTLIKDAERQPGTHTQVKRLKNKLTEIQKQLITMEESLQQKSCEKGLSALNILKQKH